MLGHAPHLRFIDMAHEVSAFQPVEAGFWLARALRYFPAGTLHVAVVDPGVGTPRALLVAFSGDQALLAPDNGLLAPLAARGKIDRVIQVDNARLVKFGVSDVSATFHGRDVFAPLAAAIAAGRCDPADLGPEVDHDQPGGMAGDHAASRRRRRRSDRRGRPLRQPHFQHRIVRRGRAADAHGASSAACACRCKRTYGDAQAGEYLGLINSFDVLEVAQCRGNAAAGLESGRGSPHFGRSGGSGPPISAQLISNANRL